MDIELCVDLVEIAVKRGFGRLAGRLLLDQLSEVPL
jgi:hypothetical protein